MAPSLHGRTGGPSAKTEPSGEGIFSWKAHLPQFFKWFFAGLLTLALTGASNTGAEPADSMQSSHCGNGPASLPKHPLYITVTEVKHNPSDKILEVSCKIFTNDFEAVLEKMSGHKVDLSSSKDQSGSAKLIEAYVIRHLHLSCDGREAALHFIGSEKEEDGTWSYFQVNEIPSVKRIDVVNNLLYEGFPQEINIMHVTVGGERKSTRLDCPAANASFQF